MAAAVHPLLWGVAAPLMAAIDSEDVALVAALLRDPSTAVGNMSNARAAAARTGNVAMYNCVFEHRPWSGCGCDGGEGEVAQHDFVTAVHNAQQHAQRKEPGDTSDTGDMGDTGPNKHAAMMAHMLTLPGPRRLAGGSSELLCYVAREGADDVVAAILEWPEAAAIAHTASPLSMDDHGYGCESTTPLRLALQWLGQQRGCAKIVQRLLKVPTVRAAVLSEADGGRTLTAAMWEPASRQAFFEEVGEGMAAMPPAYFVWPLAHAAECLSRPSLAAGATEQVTWLLQFEAARLACPSAARQLLHMPCCDCDSGDDTCVCLGERAFPESAAELLRLAPT